MCVSMNVCISMNAACVHRYTYAHIHKYTYLWLPFASIERGVHGHAHVHIHRYTHMCIAMNANAICIEHWGSCVLCRCTGSIRWLYSTMVWVPITRPVFDMLAVQVLYQALAVIGYDHITLLLVFSYYRLYFAMWRQCAMWRARVWRENVCNNSGRVMAYTASQPLFTLYHWYCVWIVCWCHIAKCKWEDVIRAREW